MKKFSLIAFLLYSALIAPLLAKASEFGLGKRDNIYLLTLTPESFFDSYVTEKLNGDVDINWSIATVCYSPDVAKIGNINAFESELRWLKGVKKKPLYSEKRLKSHDENILYSVESNSRSLLQVRGSIGDSVFTLKSNKKQCDIVLLSAFELSQLFYSDLSEFVYSSGFSLKEKYKTINSKFLLNGFKSYIEQEAARTRRTYSSYNMSEKAILKMINRINANDKSNIDYGSFKDLLSDAKVVWEQRDVFESSTNHEIGPIHIRLVLNSTQVKNIQNAANNEASIKQNDINERYNSGQGYFIKVREGYNENKFELCSIGDFENTETLSIAFKKTERVAPSKKFVTNDLDKLFSRVMRNQTNCGFIFASNEHLKLLDKGFARKAISYSLFPLSFATDDLKNLDVKITKEKAERRIWEQELATKQRQVMCGTILKSLQAQCAESGENCLRWQYVKNSCN